MMKCTLYHLRCVWRCEGVDVWGVGGDVCVVERCGYVDVWMYVWGRGVVCGCICGEGGKCGCVDEYIVLYTVP